MSSIKFHNVNIEEIINRCKLALSIENDKQLANILEVEPSTIAKWKSRKTIDYFKMLTICQQYNISLNWLFLGIGDIFIKEGKDNKNGYSIFKEKEKSIVKDEETNYITKNKIEALSAKVEILQARIAMLEKMFLRFKVEGNE